MQQLREKREEFIHIFSIQVLHQKIEFVQYKSIEFSVETMEIQPEQIMRQSSPQAQSSHQYRNCLQNKRIRKRHRRQIGQVSRHQNEHQSVISQLISKMANCFDKSKLEGINSLRKKFKSLVHIKDVFNTDITTCYQAKNQSIESNRDIYRQLLKLSGDYPIIDKIGVKNRQERSKLSLNYLRDPRNTNQRHQQQAKPMLLSQNQSLLLTKRPQIMSQVVAFIHQFGEERRFSVDRIDPILLQIMSLCKLNSEVESDIGNALQILQQRVDPFQNCHQKALETRSDELQDELSKALVLKNLHHSFNQKEIDILNYHQSIQLYEKNEQSDLFTQRITSLKKFKDYAKSRKPKTDRKPQYLLRTPCSACFSDVSEMANPIVNCPECGIRIHQGCQDIKKRCDRCTYCRTSKAQREQSQYCYICNRSCEKGLMILTVTFQAPHRYAHNFCLFLHGLWTIQNKICLGYYILLEDSGRCSICQKQGLLISCTNCGTNAHGMCSFLEGYSFKMNRGPSLSEYKVEVNCCTDRALKERLSFERKFKLNFEKGIFRQQSPLFAQFLERVQQLQKNQQLIESQHHE